jgi:hypothetical protein
MFELRFVAAAVAICSWACAGGDQPEPSDRDGAPRSAQLEQPGPASSAAAQLPDDPDSEVLGGRENPTTEGSNTNWRPTEPRLGEARHPRERPEPRTPAGNQQGNVDPSPDQDESSTLPEQPSSASGSGSGSNNSTPSPD